MDYSTYLKTDSGKQLGWYLWKHYRYLYKQIYRVSPVGNIDITRMKYIQDLMVKISYTEAKRQYPTKKELEQRKWRELCQIKEIV